ncbi:MAG: FAD-dependent monooxygenase, partial [Chloroflexales bacterium]|nr:FAD-dependent monooxygenase [Chloroflexales bacterium]
GGVHTVIDAVTDSSLIYCDDLAQVILPRWSAGRVVLLGDAAHALTPMLGAGGSKGMRGAYTVAKELAATHDYMAAFARYEHALRPSIEHLQQQSRMMGRFATSGHPLIRLLRSTLFRYAPESLVVRMRSAPPQGTAMEELAAGNISDK